MLACVKQCCVVSNCQSHFIPPRNVCTLNSVLHHFTDDCQVFKIRNLAQRRWRAEQWNKQMSTVCLLCISFTIIHHVLCEMKTFSWLDFSTNSIWFGTDDSFYLISIIQCLKLNVDAKWHHMTPQFKGHFECFRYAGKQQWHVLYYTQFWIHNFQSFSAGHATLHYTHCLAIFSSNNWHI